MYVRRQTRENDTCVHRSNTKKNTAMGIYDVVKSSVLGHLHQIKRPNDLTFGRGTRRQKKVYADCPALSTEFNPTEHPQSHQCN